MIWSGTKYKNQYGKPLRLSASLLLVYPFRVILCPSYEERRLITIIALQ